MHSGWGGAAVSVVAIVTTTRRRPASRPSARRRPQGRSKRALASTQRRPPRPSAAARVLGGTGSVVRGIAQQESEAWGVVLVTLGLLCGLGIYVEWTGPFGRVLRTATGDLVGWARLLVPVALVTVGVAMVRTAPAGDAPQRGPPARRPAASDEEPAPHDGGAARVAVGFAMLILATAGLF